MKFNSIVLIKWIAPFVGAGGLTAFQVGDPDAFAAIDAALGFAELLTIAGLGMAAAALIYPLVAAERTAQTQYESQLVLVTLPAARTPIEEERQKIKARISVLEAANRKLAASGLISIVGIAVCLLVDVPNVAAEDDKVARALPSLVHAWDAITSGSASMSVTSLGNFADVFATYGLAGLGLIYLVDGAMTAFKAIGPA